MDTPIAQLRALNRATWIDCDLTFESGIANHKQFQVFEWLGAAILLSCFGFALDGLWGNCKVSIRKSHPESYSITSHLMVVASVSVGVSHWTWIELVIA